MSYSLTREATWSMTIKIKPGRCQWPCCWRRATQMCRAMVLAGHQIITFGRWHCSKHAEKRKALNLRAMGTAMGDNVLQHADVFLLMPHRPDPTTEEER